MQYTFKETLWYFINILIAFPKNFKDFIYSLLERGKGGGKRGRETIMQERYMDRLSLLHAPTGDQTHNRGMCPDQELNQRSFILWDDAQPSELHWSGCIPNLLSRCIIRLYIPP